MPYVAVSEIVLNQPRVRALVGQSEAASVPELVRVRGQVEPGQLAVFADGKPDVAPVEGLALLADKERLAGRLHPRTLGKPRPDGAQFVGAHGVRGGHAFFQPRDVQHAAFHIHLVEPQGAGLRHAQAVPEHQKKKAAVTGLVPRAFRRR